MSVIRTYEKDTHIAIPDASAFPIGIVTNGRITLHRLSEDGRRLTVGRVRSGSVFVNPIPDHASFATVNEPTTIKWLTPSESEAWVAAHPASALNAMRVLSNEIERTREILESVVFKDSSKRTAALLLTLTETDDDRATGELTQQEMAEMIGVSRETVSRSLSVLRKAGVIESSRKRITIKDRDRLKDLAA